MPKWLQALIGFCMVAIAASALYGAFLRPGAGESLLAASSRRDALEEAQLGVVSMETLEDEYRRRHGRYAWSYVIFDSIPGAEAAFTGMQRFHIDARTSTDGMAYIVVADYSRDGMECAALHQVENAPAPRYDFLREVDLGTWDLEPNGPTRCRRTGALWPMLYWTGFGYVDD